MEMPAVPSIEGRRIRLTPLQIDNVHTHFRWNNDPELNRLDSEAPFERESLGHFLKRFEQLAYHPHPEAQDFEIHLRDGTLIGVAYVDRISWANHHCRVGVTIGEEDHRGQGYGTRTLRLLLHYLFEELDMHRVSATVFEYNQAGKHLLESVGFRQESCHRDYLYREGRHWDLETYALLSDEYYARSEALPKQVHVRRPGSNNGSASTDRIRAWPTSATNV